MAAQVPVDDSTALAGEVAVSGEMGAWQMTYLIRDLAEHGPGAPPSVLAYALSFCHWYAAAPAITQELSSFRRDSVRTST